MSTKFIIAYEVEGATYTCKVDASNRDEAERHLIALALTGRVSGEHVMDVPKVDDTALLRQALEALEKEPADYADWTRTMKAARAALRERLGETK